jgi:hypothetical protein
MTLPERGRQTDELERISKDMIMASMRHYPNFAWKDREKP